MMLCFLKVPNQVLSQLLTSKFFACPLCFSRSRPCTCCAKESNATGTEQHRHMDCPPSKYRVSPAKLSNSACSQWYLQKRQCKSRGDVKNRVTCECYYLANASFLLAVHFLRERFKGERLLAR